MDSAFKRLREGCYIGETHELLRSDEFIISKTVLADIQTTHTHKHKNCYFSYVVSGEYEEKVERKNWKRYPGSIVFHGNNRPHSQYKILNNPLILNIELTGIGNSYVDKEENIYHYLFYDMAKFGLIQNIYCLLGDANIRKENIQGTVSELFEELNSGIKIDNYTQIPPWVKVILRYLHEEYDKRISLNRLSQIVHKHPVHISRAFKRYLNCNYKDVIHLIRLNVATELLKKTNKNIAEIAYSIGFYDHAHFNRYFMKYLGVAPLEYRTSVSE